MQPSTGCDEPSMGIEPTHWTNQLNPKQGSIRCRWQVGR